MTGNINAESLNDQPYLDVDGPRDHVPVSELTGIRTNPRDKHLDISKKVKQLRTTQCLHLSVKEAAR